MMKIQILLLSFALLVTGVSHAADDPVKSLFVFQQTMANKGSTTAMMKLGEMYEQGLGTRQDFDKAIEMYRKAKAGGHTGADAAIARVVRTRQALAEAARQEKEQAAEEKQRQQARQRAEAERQAYLERQAREKERQKVALDRKRVEQARRDAAARTRAEQAARARAAAEAERKAQLQARLKKSGTIARQQPAATAKRPASNKVESFKSDPCKGPAARVMSICK